MKNLLFSHEIVHTFSKFIDRGYLDTNNIQDLMLKSIIDKIKDNNCNFDNNPLIYKDDSIALWLISFEKYFDEYALKKRKAKEKFWINVKNKAIREEKDINWTVEDMMKNFTVSTGILEKNICIQICKQILYSKISFTEKDRLSHLFLKICSYVFKDEDLFLQDISLNFEYNRLSIVYFLDIKKTIDILLTKYNEVVDKNKQSRSNK